MFLAQVGLSHGRALTSGPNTRTDSFKPRNQPLNGIPRRTTLMLLEGADPEIMGGNSTRATLDAILPEPGEGADQLGGQTPQLASWSQREFRLKPASMTGQINHPRRAIVPAGMEGKAAPVVREMAHVRLFLNQPASESAGVRASNPDRIQTERAVNVLAQPRDPHRMVDQNRSVREVTRITGSVQQTLTLSCNTPYTTDRGRRRFPLTF